MSHAGPMAFCHQRKALGRVVAISGATVLLVASLLGCSGSDRAPRLKGESAYTCRDLNMANAQDKPERASRMVSPTLRLLTAQYTGDAPIQAFYRDHVRNNFDYAVYYRQAIDETCLASAGLSLNDASAEALDSLYAEAMTKPRWATCRALDTGDLRYEAIMEEMANPTGIQIGGDSTGWKIATVMQGGPYDEAYVRGEVEAFCRQKPGVRIWDALSAAVDDEYEAIMDNLRRRGDEQKKKAWEERRQEELARIGSDLVALGTDDCFVYEQQFRAADNSGPDQGTYRRALEATLRSLSRGMPPHQMDAFEAAMLDDATTLAQELYVACENPERRKDTLFDTLVSLPVLEMVKSPELQFLEGLAHPSQAPDECDDQGMCRVVIEREAAQHALQAWRECERGTPSPGTRCFADPETALDHAIASAEVRWLERERSNLERRLAERIDVSPKDVRACESRLAAAVPDPWEREQRRERDCVEPEREARRKPMRDAFEKYGRMLEDARVRMKAIGQP